MIVQFFIFIYLVFCHIDYIHIHIFMIVTILFVGSIPNFGINIIEPRQDVLKVIYFAKDLEPGLSHYFRM